ncbi:hypothetical protein PINS_up000874 [Pythium insidiosum]|nr:hypothetical protein PINS_up000874 [Pythium insidiosum]
MDAMLRTELELSEAQRMHRRQLRRPYPDENERLHRSNRQELRLSLTEDDCDEVLVPPPALLRRTSSSSCSADIRIPSFMIPSSASAMMNSRYALIAPPCSTRTATNTSSSSDDTLRHSTTSAR